MEIAKIVKMEFREKFIEPKKIHMSTRRLRNQAKSPGSFVRGAAPRTVQCPAGEYHYGNMFGGGCTVPKFDRRRLGCGGYAANREPLPAGCSGAQANGQLYDSWNGSGSWNGNLSGSGSQGSWNGNLSGSGSQGSWSGSQSGSWNGLRSGSGSQGSWSGSQSGSLSRSRSRSPSPSRFSYDGSVSGSGSGSSRGSWTSAYPSSWSSQQYVSHMTRGVGQSWANRRYRRY
jgi:hypothetical protein